MMPKLINYLKITHFIAPCYSTLVREVSKLSASFSPIGQNESPDLLTTNLR